MGKPTSELPDITCRKGSHSVNCHLTQVNALLLCCAGVQLHCAGDIALCKCIIVLCRCAVALCRWHCVQVRRLCTQLHIWRRRCERLSRDGVWHQSSHAWRRQEESWTTCSPWSVAVDCQCQSLVVCSLTRHQSSVTHSQWRQNKVNIAGARRARSPKTVVLGMGRKPLRTK